VGRLGRPADVRLFTVVHTETNAFRNFSYLACFTTSTEGPRTFAMISAAWAVGLVVGGPIGSTFAESQSATWRWAFYLNLPLAGLALLLAVFCLPAHNLAPALSGWKRLSRIDPLGIGFNVIVPFLFAVATTFSGPIWRWASLESFVTWVVFGIALVAWSVQQGFCILTTVEERAFPMHMLSRTDLVPLWIASGCAGAAYAVTLYYIPLFFAFVLGRDTNEQTVRLLPFIVVFIVVVLFTGALLPVIGRYKIVYLCAGTCVLAGAAAMATLMDENISEAKVMAFEALIGVGLGMQFQHALGISNVICQSSRDRVDSTVICNMVQMGGIATVLAVAGCVFQNVGYNLLSDALGSAGYTEKQLREALGGVSSEVWRDTNPSISARGAQVVAEVISREFYIVVTGGALGVLCALCMRGQKLDYSRNRQPTLASSRTQAS
jgi:MFS family permease